jgi:S-adenosylmethionine decarboxylase
MKGTEIRVDLCDVERDVLMNAEQMERWCREAATKYGATVKASVHATLGEDSPPGITLAVLLDESHITVHTYADSGLMALNVFTCGKKADTFKIAMDIALSAGGRQVFTDNTPRFAESPAEHW